MNINEIIADSLSINPEKVTCESRFIEDLGADSLDLIVLTMRLEEEFNIRISDEEARDILSVNQLIKFIEDKTNVH
ncbi:MAG: acyl carrier protein [Candidatus Omnitrophica bacterium]|nr:acyl carrier protein [Candidatus Omnitrophota bacterium]